MNQSNNPTAQRSQNEITQALLNLMEKYPYEEITVKQIVLETDLVRKTFYRNFSSKDDVLNAYIDSLIVKYTNELFLGVSTPLSVIFSFAEKNKDLIQILSSNNMLYLLLTRLNEQIPKISATSDVSRNPFLQMFGDIEPDYLIAFNIGAIWNTIFMWANRGMKEPLEDVRQKLEEYIAKTY